MVDVKRRVIRIFISVVGVLGLSSCADFEPQLGSDVMLTCTMFSDPDAYRVGVLMVLSSGSDAKSYIDGAVREMRYPDVVDTLESIDLKNKFASALEEFAFAYYINDEALESIASRNLDSVAVSLKSRCEDLGMDYAGLNSN